MLQNAYFVAKIGADTAENEQHFAEIADGGTSRTASNATRRAQSGLHCVDLAMFFPSMSPSSFSFVPRIPCFLFWQSRASVTTGDNSSFLATQHDDIYEGKLQEQKNSSIRHDGVNHQLMHWFIKT